MAKVLKKFEFKAAASRAKYPWDTWFDGRIHGLTQAEDFPDIGDINHMVPKIRTAAKNRYKTVKVQIDKTDETSPMVVLQATDMTTEERAAEDARRAEEKAKRKAAGQAEQTPEEQEAAAA